MNQQWCLDSDPGYSPLGLHEWRKHPLRAGQSGDVAMVTHADRSWRIAHVPTTGEIYVYTDNSDRFLVITGADRVPTSAYPQSDQLADWVMTYRLYGWTITIPDGPYVWLDPAFPCNVMEMLTNHQPIIVPSIAQVYLAEHQPDRHYRREVLTASNFNAAHAHSRTQTITQTASDLRLWARLLESKFMPETVEADSLRVTGAATINLALYNGSCHDLFFGCWQGQGSNWLGRLLMARRNTLNTLNRITDLVQGVRS